MIEKAIHYCWFGGSLPDKVRSRVERWGQICKGYEIVEWNDENYPLNGPRFVQQAAENQKWSFVSDYARLDVLDRYGGIYLDTDVEVLKPFDDLLEQECFLGMENDTSVAMSTIGAVPSCWFIQEMKALYKELDFVGDDGRLMMEPNVQKATRLLKSRGLDISCIPCNVDGVNVYPADYFIAKSYSTEKTFISDRTYCVHEYDASWMSEERRRYEQRIKLLKKIVGVKAGRQIVKLLGLKPPEERAVNPR